MTPLSEKHGYRNIEYAIIELGKETWGWTFYPKLQFGTMQQGPRRGEISGTRDDAVQACKAAIDTWINGGRSK